MPAYNTIALQHYWGFKWLDRTGLKAGWLVVLVFALNWLVLLAAELSGVTVFESQVLQWLFPTLLSLFLVIWIALARGAQFDFDHMVSSGLAEGHLYADFIVCRRRSVRLTELAIGVVLGVLVYFIGRGFEAGGDLGSSLVSIFNDLRNSTVTGLYELLEISLFGLLGICCVRNASFLYRQVGLFSIIARGVSVNLLCTEPLGEFANQPLRTLIGTMATLSVMLFMLNSSDSLISQYYLLGIPIQILMVVLTIYVSRPMLQIRKKIRQCKQLELEKVRAAIAGDRDALKETCIHPHEDDFTFADLLYYEDKIDALWEWPLNGQVRRIVFYLILPPLAWSLAAFVEMSLDSLIQ
jgi:hypothetical protein